MRLRGGTSEEMFLENVKNHINSSICTIKSRQVRTNDTRKKQIRSTSKLKMFLLQIIPSRKWKDKPQTRRQYLKILYLIMEFYLEYIKNYYNSIIEFF